MKLEDIMDEWAKDSKVDDCDLDAESLNIPILHNKYLILYTNSRIAYRALLEKKKRLIRIKTDYYSGDLNNPEDLEEYGLEPFKKVLTKTKIEQYVDADDEVVKINTKIALIEEKLSYLESVLKSINNRNWNIRNAIDFMRFKSGG